jgi:hypothetical protein
VKIDERLGLRVALAAVVVRLVESESGFLSLRSLPFSASMIHHCFASFLLFLFHLLSVCVSVEEANFWSGGKFWFFDKIGSTPIRDTVSLTFAWRSLDGSTLTSHEIWPTVHSCFC